MIYIYNHKSKIISPITGKACDLTLFELEKNISTDDIIVLPEELYLNFVFRKTLGAYLGDKIVTVLPFTSFAALCFQTNCLTSKNSKGIFLYIGLLKIEIITLTNLENKWYADSSKKTNEIESLSDFIENQLKRELTFLERNQLQKEVDSLQIYLDKGNKLGESVKNIFLESPVAIPELSFLNTLKTKEIVNYRKQTSELLLNIMNNEAKSLFVAGLWSSFYTIKCNDSYIEIPAGSEFNLNVSGFNSNHEYNIIFNKRQFSEIPPFFIHNEKNLENEVVKALELNYIGNALVFTENNIFLLK